MNARRGWVRAQVRRRDQVARELGRFISDRELNVYEDDDGRWLIECPQCEPWPEELQYGCVACGGARATPAGEAITEGIVVRPDGTRAVLEFDVHAAREHARSLIALGAEQAAFEAWARAQGLGPECGQLYGAEYIEHETWPGRMPARWARQGGDRRAPMGRAYKRLGQRILDALVGQPDACGHWTANDGQAMCTVIIDHVPTVTPCDCRGSGHNLRGVLAPRVARDWTERLSQDAQLRRRRCDQGMDEDGIRNTQDSWLDDETITGAMAPGWALFRLREREAGTSTQDELDSGALTIATRVVPRGEHRDCGVEPDHDLDRRISERLWDPMWVEPKTVKLPAGVQGPENLCDFDPDPRWLRGEDRHDERQRAKARR